MSENKDYLDGLTVFAKVEENKRKIEDLIDPTIFVLNPEVEKLQNEIAELQNKCPHCYEKGICKYCGKEEK
jgi:hypothetical protein